MRTAYARGTVPLQPAEALALDRRRSLADVHRGLRAGGRALARLARRGRARELGVEPAVAAA